MQNTVLRPGFRDNSTADIIKIHQPMLHYGRGAVRRGEATDEPTRENARPTHTDCHNSFSLQHDPMCVGGFPLILALTRSRPLARPCGPSGCPNSFRRGRRKSGPVAGDLRMPPANPATVFLRAAGTASPSPVGRGRGEGEGPAKLPSSSDPEIHFGNRFGRQLISYLHQATSSSQS